MWIVLGAAVGLIAWVGLLGIKRMALGVCVVTGAAAALVGGVAMDSTVGDIATVRVIISAGGSYTAATFGLGPFVVAGAAALVALIVGHRVTGCVITADSETQLAHRLAKLGPLPT